MQGTNYLLSGLASVGTIDTLNQIMARGVDELAYDFDTPNQRFVGVGMLLRPEHADAPAGGLVTIETPSAPTSSDPAAS